MPTTMTLESRAKASALSTRERMLFSALTLFVERGFHGTAVPAIAEHAGFAAGTIYRHFKSKEELVNVLVRMLRQEVIDSMVKTIPDMNDFRVVFDHVFDCLWSYLYENFKSFRFLELHHHQDYLEETTRQLEDHIYQVAEVVISMGQAKGELRSGDPRVVASAAYGVFVGVARALSNGKSTFDEETKAVTYSACLNVFLRPAL